MLVVLAGLGSIAHIYRYDISRSQTLSEPGGEAGPEVLEHKFVPGIQLTFIIAKLPPCIVWIATLFLNNFTPVPTLRPSTHSATFAAQLRRVTTAALCVLKNRLVAGREQPLERWNNRLLID